jgi:uncharacterized protein (UPF0216 family)
MHLDINEDIYRKRVKVDEILRFSQFIGILIAMDNHTNPKGKTLGEYLTSRDLHIMNEESGQTTFQSRRERSNIDLTIVNNQLLKKFNNWEISEDESCSDHIIKFKIGHENNHAPQSHRDQVHYKRTKLQQIP